MDVLQRHHVRVTGRPDGPTLVLAHGFGCDQHMWRHVAPAFEDRFRVVVFDHAGAGAAGRAAYDPERHATLHGYAQDVVDICRALDVRDGAFVGHSVSAMVGVLADLADPGLFARLVLVGPSPRYTDDEGYVGGFSDADIRDLLESLDSNYLGWSSVMAPMIMANGARPELGQELTESFCRADPDLAAHFARVTFLSDNRADLPRVTTPALVLQCSEDVIAPLVVGRYVADAMPAATLVQLDATGHCPHLSAPEETVAAMEPFLAPLLAVPTR